MKTSKYVILLGKDPEALAPCTTWSDAAPFFGSKRYDEQVAGAFTTDIEDLFWEMYLSLRENPLSMWYWVIVDGVQIVSGAIDPDDIEILAENLSVPEWVSDRDDVNI